MLKNVKIHVHLLWLTVPGYELFECPSYLYTVNFLIQVSEVTGFY